MNRRAYFIDRLKRMSAHETILADAWGHDLSAALANPIGETAAGIALLRQSHARAVASVQIVDLVRAFIEQLPAGSDPITELTRALAQTGQEVSL